MRVMSRAEETLFEELLEIANGDFALVREALEQAEREARKPPTLDSIVRYIMREQDYDLDRVMNHNHAERPVTDDGRIKRLINRVLRRSV